MSSTRGRSIRQNSATTPAIHTFLQIRGSPATARLGPQGFPLGWCNTTEHLKSTTTCERCTGSLFGGMSWHGCSPVPIRIDKVSVSVHPWLDFCPPPGEAARHPANCCPPSPYRRVRFSVFLMVTFCSRLDLSAIPNRLVSPDKLLPSAWWQTLGKEPGEFKKKKKKVRKKIFFSPSTLSRWCGSFSLLFFFVTATWSGRSTEVVTPFILRLIGFGTLSRLCLGSLPSTRLYVSYPPTRAMQW